MRVRTAIITAAGRGTRLAPATAVVPKVLLPLINVPVIQIAVEEAVEAGLERIAVVGGRDLELIRRHFDALGTAYAERLRWVSQPEPRGLGDAIRCARGEVGEEPFAVLFGDTAYLGDNPTKRLCADFDQHAESLIGAQRIPIERCIHRGMLDTHPLPDGRLRLTRIVEKPQPSASPSDLAVAARNLFTPAIFETIEQVELDEGGEVQLTPAVNSLAKREPIAAIEITEPRLDVGNPEDYFHAICQVAKRRLDLTEERTS